MKNNQSGAKTVLSMIVDSFLWAVLATIVFAFLFGYKMILVNGWSSQPTIPYQSLIITSKFKQKDLKVGDFITYSYSGNSYITHQVIAIKTDGTYFEQGETFTAVIDGTEYNMVFGYKLNSDGTCTANADNADSAISTNCNIIVMQHTFTNNELNIDATKEYLNYNTNFVGKVIFISYPLGITAFTIKGNPFVLIGIIVCLALTVFVKYYYNLDPTFY